jgi:hypothetical protein
MQKKCSAISVLPRQICKLRQCFIQEAAVTAVIIAQIADILSAASAAAEIYMRAVFAGRFPAGRTGNEALCTV